jgi:arginine utilization protein RocB
MPTIPDPAKLVERALSAGRYIVDREWKQYQRYLKKHKQKHGNTPEQPPLIFDEYCVMLRKTGDRSPDAQNQP